MMLLDEAENMLKRTYSYCIDEVLKEKKEDPRNKKVICRGYGNIYKAPIETRIGRNELCPCGSGKKYKKCCMEKGDCTL